MKKEQALKVSLWLTYLLGLGLTWGVSGLVFEPREVVYDTAEVCGLEPAVPDYPQHAFKAGMTVGEYAQAKADHAAWKECAKRSTTGMAHGPRTVVRLLASAAWPATLSVWIGGHGARGLFDAVAGEGS